MEFSLVGIMVCLALLAFGLCLRSPITVALFASLPFAATAFVTLTRLGGASPLIYTVFALMLIAFAATRPRILDKIGILFGHHWVPWLVLFLTIYVMASAFLFPRLLLGQTTVFVPDAGVISERLLAPVSGNVTQAAYFTLGALVFYAFYLLRRESSGLGSVRRGFFVFAAFQVALGVIDIGGKLTGFNDIFAPIRTASYGMLTEVTVASFWRIAGACSEASAFAAISVPCFAFVFTYWRATGSGIALILALPLLGLLLLSTSSAAYVTLALLALFLAASLLHAIYANRLSPRDIAVVAIIMVGVAVLIAVYLSDERLLDPFANLLNLMVFEKLSSGSGIQRVYWNMKSLQSIVDTNWFGVGMGSSRSSSWIVSVLSQLGIIGTLMMAALVVFLLRGMRGLERAVDSTRLNIANSARAAGLASLLVVSISGGSADPGLIFFISLAVVLSCREDARLKQVLGRSRMAGRSVRPHNRPEPECAAPEVPGGAYGFSPNLSRL